MLRTAKEVREMMKAREAEIVRAECVRVEEFINKFASKEIERDAYHGLYFTEVKPAEVWNERMKNYAVQFLTEAGYTADWTPEGKIRISW